MKKNTLALLTVVVFLFASATAQAARSIVVSESSLSKDGKNYEIQLDCTAHTDGEFTPAVQIVPSDGYNYWEHGFYIYEVKALNPGSGYATVAAAVTITDEDGYVLLASGELNLSTVASTEAEAVLGKARAVRSKMSVLIGDTGTAANTVKLRIILAR